MKYALACAFILLAGAAAAASQQETGRNARKAQAPAGGITSPGFSSDFLDRAAQYCMAEIELGKMAEEKAFSTQVESFARQAVANYTKIQGGVQNAARTLGLQLPVELTLQDQTLKGNLQKEKPRKFDDDYMNDMVRSSEKQLDDFEAEAKSGRTTQVKALAARDIPLVKSVSEMAAKTNQIVRAYQMTARPQYR
jgi:putative membrane protein